MKPEQLYYISPLQLLKRVKKVTTPFIQCFMADKTFPKSSS